MKTSFIISKKKITLKYERKMPEKEVLKMKSFVTNKGDKFDSIDFAGFVNPTIELWKLAVESRSNFKKIWMYEDPKYSEEE